MFFQPILSFSTDTPIATFSIFRFPVHKRWKAFRQMGEKFLLKKMPEGMNFGKMLGSGRNGFSLLPDFSQYALLAGWENASSADNFFLQNPVFNEYAFHAEEAYHIQMLPLQSHGKWDGENPFQPHDVPLNIHKPIIVLTRATIRLQKLINFWKNVPKAQQAIRKSAGVWLSFGIGEVPWVQQATLSIWKNAEAMRDFAYHKTYHKEIVQQTRQQDWYSEDLFARFLPVGTQGTYQGRDVLKEEFEFQSKNEIISTGIPSPE